MGDTKSATAKDWHETLVCAVKAKDATGVTFALQNGADPNTKCNYGIHMNNPALSCAVNKGYAEVVEALLQARNVNINAIGTSFCTALQEAVSASNSRIVQLLLTKGADVNLSSGYLGLEIMPLEVAASNGCLDCCSLLLQHGAKVETISAPLLVAVENKHKEVCSLLLENGANPNPNTLVSPLDIAAEYGQIEICQLLLDYGANVNHIFSSPLNAAYKNGHMEVCSLLLQHGADEIPFRDLLLIAAAEHGWKEVCWLLLLSGANPIVKDFKGRSAADIAKEHGHHELAEWLVKQKQLISPTNQSSEGYCIGFQMSVRKIFDKILKYLQQRCDKVARFDEKM